MKTAADSSMPSKRPVSQGRAAWRRFRANPSAVIGLVVLTLMLAACLLGLIYARSGPGGARFEAVDADRSVSKNPERAAPELPVGGFSLAHPFGLNADGDEARLLGSDALGRDYLARLLFGGVVSLLIGVSAAFAAAVVGTIYGMVSGYVGGRVDNFMMRLVEILYSLPYMLLVILTFFLLNGRFVDLIPDQGLRSIVCMFVSVAAFNWMTEARVVRGQVLQLRNMPYIEAARAIGVPSWRILLVHMLPNLMGPIIVVATLMVPQAILLESFLSFLGIGIQEPQATWGLLAADGVKTINTVQNHYWLLIPPCATLAVTLLALNFVGDGLRDAFDPHGRR